ncbi:MAG: hypothetical protein AAF703_20220 [Cyanobacteria bacterium P01_D01_bin.105]
MNTLTQRLYAAWQQAVDDNKLINEFQAAADDPDGRWAARDTIAFGVRCEPSQNALSEKEQRNSQSNNLYYAQNLTQARAIPGAVEEKLIPELGFICQYNGYRALRPGGQLKPLGRQADISPAVEDCRFSCQDPSDPLSLLVREPLLQVPLTHYVWNAYYNAAPIDPNGHFLWVPADRKSTDSGPDELVLTHYLQQLSLAFLEDAMSLFKQLEGTLLFFNSLHSGASVNHIHFQAIARSTPLPAETWPLTTTDKGYALLKGYPARVITFDIETAPAKLFSHIDRLQQQEIPFNLMLAGSRIFLIPRNIDHEIVSEFAGNGIAALGMCGKIVTVDYQSYQNVNQSRIQSAFNKMTYQN